MELSVRRLRVYATSDHRRKGDANGAIRGILVASAYALFTEVAVTSKSRSGLPLVAGVASLALLWPINASAQYHGHPHGGRVHGAVVVGAPYYRPYYYRPYYYRPYWFGIGFGYGYGYPYPYPYAWYPPYPYYYGYYDNTGSARLEVTPREAQVYVDGSFVGTVDDFDGTFQRLNLAPGKHDLALYVEGYRTVHQPVLFRPGTTLKITVAMQPLGPGETNEKPAPNPDRVPPAAIPRDRADACHRLRDRRRMNVEVRRCQSTAAIATRPSAPSRCACSRRTPKS